MSHFTTENMIVTPLGVCNGGVKAIRFLFSMAKEKDIGYLCKATVSNRNGLLVQKALLSNFVLMEKKEPKDSFCIS